MVSCRDGNLFGWGLKYQMCLEQMLQYWALYADYYQSISISNLTDILRPTHDYVCFHVQMYAFVSQTQALLISFTDFFKACSKAMPQRRKSQLATLLHRTTPATTTTTSLQRVATQLLLMLLTLEKVRQHKAFYAASNRGWEVAQTSSSSITFFLYLLHVCLLAHSPASLRA